MTERNSVSLVVIFLSAVLAVIFWVFVNWERLV